jgi:AraC family transcriptional regulator of adaptative response / DNA-3-methyladenine glycosylase II
MTVGSCNCRIVHTDFDPCYRAIQSKDARFDGWFVTAVLTTGIYCRPGCRCDRCSPAMSASTAAAAAQRPDSAPVSAADPTRPDPTRPVARLTGMEYARQHYAVIVW